MKFISFTLICCLFFGSIVHFAAADDPTCTNHPIFSMAKSFLKRTVSDNELGTKVMEQFISEFSSATPKQLTVDELGVCSQFSGLKTCCSKEMTGFFDKVATFTGEAIQRAGNPLLKIVELIKKILITDGCSTKLKTMSAQDIINDPASIILKGFYDQFQQGKLPFSKVVAAMNRGALCSICVNTDAVLNYIIGGQVVVLSSSLYDFETAVQSSWEILNDSIQSGDQMSIFTEFFNNYGTELCDNSYYNTFFGQYNKSVSGLKFSPIDNNTKQQKCSGLVFFNEKPMCETSQDKLTGIDQVIDSYVAPNQRRFLGTENVEDAISSGESTIGVPMYLPSQMDDKIIITGQTQISFEGDLKESDPKTPDPLAPSPQNSGSNTSAASTTSLIRLCFGVFFAISTLLIL